MVLLLALLSIGNIFGQKFTASVSKNPVAVGEVFELTLTFAGSDINGITSFQAPSMTGFIVASGPNQSSSVQIINGAMSANRSFIYELQAKEKGKFTIGAASVIFKGTTVKSQPIVVEIVVGQPKQNKQGQGDADVSNSELADRVFIRASADKTTAYIGEQINVTYKLYTRARIQAPQVSKLPSYQNFWSEEIVIPPNTPATQEVVNGKQYVAYLLKKAALFPSSSGELSVTPMRLKIPVLIEKRRKPSNNPFDDFFNDPFFNNQTQKVEFEAVSNTLKIKAQPYPDNGKPASFNGAVGNYTMSVTFDKTKGKQNEPISMKVTIAGTGNIQLISPPELNLPATIEKYDPKINDEILRSGTVSGKKVFEYLLIPRTEGQLNLKGIEFSYFSPDKHKYFTVTSQPVTLQIEKGSDTYTAGASGMSKESVKMLGEDIRFVKTRLEDVSPAEYSAVNSPICWVFFALPLVLVIGLTIWKARQDKLLLDMNFVRNRKAERLAKSKLKTAFRALTIHQVDLFYAELSAGLFGYAENKFAISRSEFTIDKFREELTRSGMTQEIIDAYIATIERCEFARFAPQADKERDMATVYENTKKLIMATEDQLQALRGKK
ncbi:MAG: BatD family protein [Ignavibacteria bacterium]|nr:BatD family protein [Ignavibacteria bacterium]